MAAAHTCLMRGAWQGDGAPVVLLHGQPGGAADWQSVLPLLRDMRLLVPDRPGYDGTNAGGFAWNADALARLLGQTEVERVVIVGHSWGGGVALQLAMDYPGRVAGLCLIGSVGSPRAFTRTDRLYALPGVRRAAGTAVCCCAAFAPGLFASATGSVLKPLQRAQLRAAGRRWLAQGAARSYGVEQAALVQEAARLRDRLPDVMTRCVVLSGDADRSVPPLAAADLAARLPHAVLQSVAGGHLLPLECPRAVADAVRRTVALAVW